MIRRREFITLLGGAAAWPVMARAQQGVDRVRRVAVLVGSAQTDEVAQRRVATFRKRMQELGWIEGQTVRFEFRRDAGDTEQIARHAAELVAARPDVIMAISSPVVAAAQAGQRERSHRLRRCGRPSGRWFRGEPVKTRRQRYRIQ